MFSILFFDRKRNTNVTVVTLGTLTRRTSKHISQQSMRTKNIHVRNVTRFLNMRKI